MINANTHTPASHRKKYMDVFNGKNTQPIQSIPLVAGNKPQPTPTFGASKKMVSSEPKKIFGLDTKSVVAVVSIALFFVFSMAGVLVSLQQRMNPEEVAVPTAPKSKPAAAEIIEVESSSCSLAFNIAEPSPSPTPSVSPSPSPSVSPSPSPTPSVSPSPSPSVSPSPTPSVSPSPSPSPVTYGCNSDCETNEQCQAVSDSYICYQNNCRLDSNPSASNCQSTTYKPPVIGCNDACVNNVDCANSEQICYNNACRLATNPTSSTCSVAQTTTYQAPKGEQPVLPAELPQSGSNIILDWLKAGLGVIGIGAVLLLLL